MQPGPSPLEALQSQPLLRDLPGVHLARVVARMEWQVQAPGQTLTPQGAAADALYIIVEGQAECLVDGRLAGTLGPGELIGQEAAGLTRYSRTVRALTEVRVWRIPRVAVIALCTAVAHLEARLIHSMQPASSPSATSETGAPSTAHPAAATPAPTPANAATREPSNKTLVGWAAVLVLPPLVFALVHAQGLSLQAGIFLAILSLVGVMWVFQLVDDFIPPLLALVCMLFIGLAPVSVVLKSFSSPSFLVLMSVLALASMLTTSGLSNRLLLLLLRWLPAGGTWWQAVMLVYGLLLSMGTPSGNNRMALMVPMFKDMAFGLRMAPRSAVRTALFVGTYGGAMIFSCALATSKSATISVIGFLPQNLQNHYAGVFWIVAAAVPILILVAVHLAAVRFMFPKQESSPTPRRAIDDQLTLLGPWSLQEKVTVAAFVLFLGGSVTTAIHQVAPAAMAGGILICLLVTGVMTKTDYQRAIDWPMIAFLMSVDCLVGVMEYLGLSAQLSAFLGEQINFIDGRLVVFLLVALALVLTVRLVLPIPAGMILSAVVLLPIAQAEGVSLWICIFAVAMFSDIWFLPFQNTIYMVAVNAGIEQEVDRAAFMRHNMVMNAARVACVFASIPFWKGLGLA